MVSGVHCGSSNIFSENKRGNYYITLANILKSFHFTPPPPRAQAFEDFFEH